MGGYDYLCPPVYKIIDSGYGSSYPVVLAYFSVSYRHIEINSQEYNLAFILGVLEIGNQQFRVQSFFPTSSIKSTTLDE